MMLVRFMLTFLKTVENVEETLCVEHVALQKIYLILLMFYATILGGGGKVGNVTMCKGSDVKVSSLKGVVGNNLLELASEGI